MKNDTQSPSNPHTKRKAANKDRRMKASESLIAIRTCEISEIRRFTAMNGYKSAIITQKFPRKHIYYEATVISQVGHCRVGFATGSAEVNGPIGMDEHGYSFGSKNGYLFHRSKRVKYGERYSNTDIIGCLLFSSGNRQNLLFFVNGEAVSEKPLVLKAGRYYPAVSMYSNCLLDVNLGPYFVFEDKIIQKYEFMKGYQ